MTSDTALLVMLCILYAGGALLVLLVIALLVASEHPGEDAPGVERRT